MEKNSENKRRRSRVSQTDIPAYSLTQALRVAEVLSDQFAKKPTKPLNVAQALDIKPTSSGFRMLTGAATAYGLTTGGYNAQEIGLTDLGRRCIAPTTEGDDLMAKREALLKPSIINKFLTNYDSEKLPTDRMGVNVLEEWGIAADRAPGILDMIKSSAKFYGLTKEIRGDSYVDLAHQPSLSPVTEDYEDMPIEPEPEAELSFLAGDAEEHDDSLIVPKIPRVFITHGKNKAVVNQLKELLSYGKFEPVVAVEHETTAKPVPQKVMDEMRSCGAAVIHVGNEKRLMDTEGNEVPLLNQNVLIEIGAAMALYGDKFVLLVEEGVELPSNLQGLYEVRYSGEKLELDAAMKLLKSFNEFTGTRE